MAENRAEKLFSEFPPVTTAEWEAVIEKDLKGADYEKKLVWKTMEGFNLRPYYRAEDLANVRHLGTKPGEFPFVRGTKETNDWFVRQEVTVTDPQTANKQAKELLTKGITSLGFVLTAKEFTAADLDTLLEGITIGETELNFSGCGAKTAAPLFLAKLKAIGFPADKPVRASFDIDPIIKKMTLKGKELCCSGKECKGGLKELVEGGAAYRDLRFVTVNGSVFANAGATIVQELAYTLAAAHDYLVMLTDQGADAKAAAKTIKFNMAVGPLYFMEIAKFRAARMLWANIVEAYKTGSNCAAKMNVFAVTTRWNNTMYDPYVNMLRGTTEAMSAAIAGVSSIEVLPFDSAYETPTEFSERIARNVQLLLKEESHFDQVIDPAGGSYYLETLTQSIADNAWALFKELEAKGGYVEAFKAGAVQAAIAESAAKRDKNIATRRDILLGTNQYPNFQETIKEAPEKAEKKCSCKCAHEAVYQPIKMYRGGEAFEAMRLATDQSGKSPVAFMLTVGNLAMARARAQFSSNFFACAGIRIVDNNLFASVEEGVKAALDAKADIVVICSSDDEYATLAPQAYAALKGKAIFTVAGAPACQADLEAQGIKNFISVRSNVLETLKQYQQELGINK